MNAKMTKNVVNELRGFLRKQYDFTNYSEYQRAYDDLHRMFTIGSQKKIKGLWINVNNKYAK